MDESNFVALFCSLLQLSAEDNDKEYRGIANNCYFNYISLCSVVFKMKSDFRFGELLKGIDIVMNDGFFYSISLMMGINRARSKYLITAVDGDNYYVSRVYDKTTILRNNAEWIPIMRELVREYLDYRKIREEQEDYVDGRSFSMRDVFNLKLKLREMRDED